MPSLKASAYRDYIEVLRSLDFFNEANLNKSELIYRIGNSETEFISVDEPQKIRGRKRVDLWINEANELSYEDFRQLLLRTTGQVFIDYNPSDEFHWIYEHVIPRDDCDFIKSTYLDNPFIEKSIIKEIELLKDVDPNYWKIYGLGERGMSESKIYSNWDLCDNFPDGCDIIYGLDFGYNNETALVKVGIKERDIYVQELIYEKHLTNADLIEKIKKLEINGLIFADSAEPQRIEELIRAGISVRPTIKDGKVKLGIDLIKTYKIHITKESVNGQKEIRSYSWKTDRDGKVLDDPVKVNDHFCFSGNTDILMSDGSTKKIKDIKIGDIVETENGKNRVVAKALTKRSAEVVEAQFSTGERLVATPDHPIYTNRGKVSLDAVRYDDIVKTWRTKQLYSIIKDITGTVNTIVQLGESLKEERGYTVQSGSITMEKYQEDSLSIISTTIEETMRSLILRLKQCIAIYQTIKKKDSKIKKLEIRISNTLKELDLLQKSGIDQKKAESGMSLMEKSHIKIEKHLLRIVKFVEKSMKHINLNEADFVTKIVKLKHLEPEDVYNLTVEVDHNYYANGVLVSNCDATRYAVYTYTKQPAPTITWV